jgi:hypothetical protein
MPAIDPVKAQVWGQFWHKRPLVHSDGAFANLVPFRATAAKQACAQSPSHRKCLMLHEKRRLSTGEGDPYYYY